MLRYQPFILGLITEFLWFPTQTLSHSQNGPRVQKPVIRSFCAPDVNPCTDKICLICSFDIRDTLEKERQALTFPCHLFIASSLLNKCNWQDRLISWLMGKQWSDLCFPTCNLKSDFGIMAWIVLNLTAVLHVLPHSPINVISHRGMNCLDFLKYLLTARKINEWNDVYPNWGKYA